MTDAKPPASLAEALAALQAQMPAVGKHATADVRKEGKKLYDYAYAPGEAITPVLYPLMAPLGLSFTAAPGWHYGNDAHRFVLHYELLHSSGESRQGDYPLPDPDRYGPQDLGKAITYARRYALCALVGLFPGGDDSDANGMQDTAAAPDETDRPRVRRAVSSQEKQRAKTTHTKAGTTRHEKAQAEDPWAGRPPEEREQAPGTVNDLQLRAIWMLLKDRAGVTDSDAAHAMARAALGLADDALLTDPDPETGEVRETFRRLSHAQAAEFIRQLQDGAPE